MDDKPLTVPLTPAVRRRGRKRTLPLLVLPAGLVATPRARLTFCCSVCGREFSHAYKLERHALIHTGETPHRCSLCGRGFNQKGNLKTHQKVHSGEGQDQTINYEGRGVAKCDPSPLRRGTKWSLLVINRLSQNI